MRNHLFLILISLSLLVACGGTSKGPPPALNRQAPSEAAQTLLVDLNSMNIPPRNLTDLTERLTAATDIPATIQHTETPYEVGDFVTFWYKDQNSGTNVQVDAELYYRSDDLYMWFEDGLRVRDSELSEATRFLENQLLPTHRAFFGDENRPGVDGDDRVHLLHLEEIGGIAAAYFSSADGYPQSVNQFSNEREILYISMKSRGLASDEYYGSVAQEMQHLIHQNTDPNEAAWLNEGMSELALHLNGLEPDREAQYAERSDTQLNNLSYDPDAIGAHYAASFLFTNYFREQFGESATQSLARNPANGLQGFDVILESLQSGLTVDQFFANWLVANYLAGIDRAMAPYQYETLAIPEIQLAADHRRFPVTEAAGVSQYGADYIRVRGDQPLELTFTGSQRVSLLGTEAHSGAAIWSSVPADKSAVTLTGRFDLTDTSTATLSFWTWYEIEKDWDYAYLAISTDDGSSWTLLETDAMSRDNPQGNSFGPAFTGNSGGGEMPIWIEQSVDLTSYSGEEILLRFEYVTDDAIHFAGFAIDDVTIEAIGFSDDMETTNPVWEPQGFIRHENHLPQHYIVQLIYLGEDNVRIEEVILSDDRTATWPIQLDDDFDEAILIVAGRTPVTSQPAGYQYTLTNP